MPGLPSSLDWSQLPPPGDPDAVGIGLARWQAAAEDAHDPRLAASMRALAAADTGRRLLSSLFGNSPFLTRCCLKEPALTLRLAELGPGRTFADVLDALNHHSVETHDTAALMTLLRQARRRAALAVAVADIAGLWPLERTTEALSAFAEAALQACLRQLIPDAARSGFVVLAVGKLGARELNYSSDVDLILLYDSAKLKGSGNRTPAETAVRAGRELVRLLSERTEDGYVCRVDLRLRPDPGSTPLALSTAAALAYYESVGQNWERAALIKARPVAGDLAAGAAFLAELRPFLWRKHLDFAAISDIHSIKRQINARYGGSRIAVAGHDVKLGRGGIREIEFFAQTQQLIWGGRRAELRVAGTCDALAALAAAGLIGRDTAATLTDAYRFLRRVEHRLQMVDDRQTHMVPSDAAGLNRLALFLAFPEASAFAAELTRQLAAVERSYAKLFEEAPSLAARGNLVFTGFEDDPETIATLRRLGFAEPSAVAALVRAWHHGRYRAMRSARARELLTELVPGLLAAIGAGANPDSALRRFDRFLERLPAGVQLLSLLAKNPGLLGLVAEIMSVAPSLADRLALRPALFDGVLAAGFFDPPPAPSALAEDLEQLLAGARHYEDVLLLARRWVSERKFQIGVQLLRHRLDGVTAGYAFSDVAETAIAALLPRVEAEFARSHGVVTGGSMLVLGLGKLGSREMTVTSDLDLILVYDAPDGVEASLGPRPLPVQTYYARLSQRLINALTAHTAEGALYEVDMRLRPSGAAGPLATSLAAFAKYQAEQAWTWEHMALTRARPVAGPAALRDRVGATIQAVLTRPRDAARLVADVADMRRRIAEQHPAPLPFDVKHRPGGMVDVEFIAQYLQLREAHAHPAVLRHETQAALAALLEAGALEAGTAAALRDALRLWSTVQSLLKLTLDEPFEEAHIPAPLGAILAKGAGAVDFALLKRDMDAAAARVRGIYGALVETAAAPVADNTEDGTR
jgi:[glutamine synthetase] adenylyltransferase / [glutamine synthetase]-adenylyl-L-tyrosine phosphorylase